MANKTGKGNFSSDRQPAVRGRRGKDKATLLLEALMAVVNKAAEEDPDIVPVSNKDDALQMFNMHLVGRALNSRDSASQGLLKEMLDRLHPTSKATLPAIEFPFRENGSASDKIEDVQAAVASGLLPVDMGNTMVNMIVAGIKVFEVTELAERLARIEEMLNKDPDGA